MKKDFARLCDEIGMSMSTAFCVFAKAAVRKQGIPFEVTLLDENISDKKRQRFSRKKRYSAFIFVKNAEYPNCLSIKEVKNA